MSRTGLPIRRAGSGYPSQGRAAKEEIHNTLILDESANGLHEPDILQQIALLRKLIVNKGLAIIAIEHNLRFIGQAA